MLGQATSERADVSRKCVEHYSVNIVQADRWAIVRSVRLGDRSIDFGAPADRLSGRLNLLELGSLGHERVHHLQSAAARVGVPAVLLNLGGGRCLLVSAL